MLLVGPDPGCAVATIATDLPVEPGVVTVVSLLTNARDWRWLAEAVAASAPKGVAVRLAVSNAGAPQEGDGQSTARLLAERLRADVIAPDGQVLLIPGGSAFVVAPSGQGTQPTGESGRWVRFSPDGTVVPLGARFPEPPWAQAAARLMGDRGGGVTVVEVPAGLWASTGGNGSAPRLDDLAFCVPLDAELCTLIVGSAAGTRPDPEAVVSALVDLPPAARDRLLVAPYGSGARSAGVVAGELARRWDRPVYLSNGIPAIGSDGVRRTLVTEDDGSPLWWPASSRVRCGPEGPPVPVEPTPLLADVPSVADRVWALREPWLVEQTHFGLWIRHLDAPASVEQVAQIPWDPRWLTVVAGVPGQPSDGVRPVLAGLLGRFPEQVKARTRVVSPELLSRLAGPIRR
ncbi:hypothetical protein O7632_13305 [Solwaraspora sp. WMMD406]|uniref:hypothetical protein n=1 Tax=Solwaraspora sp. WMMD406 TaxID=3016095 RepID=UPI002417CFB1|nr:hypothetical protein [Solwaraspora sp. WMMD406]MDG4765068.1 hypothetical protein [Solwaraspora sp. WMMD406]